MDSLANPSSPATPTETATGGGIFNTDTHRSWSNSSKVHEILQFLQSDDVDLKLDAAMEIRRLTKTSQRYRRHFSSAVKPLVEMLRYDSIEANEAALLALLNLGVKDDRNKTSIVDEGALDPIINFLYSENETLMEHATACLLTLSASSGNKPIIGSCGAIPPLVEILNHGSMQPRVDAVMALYNLSTNAGNLGLILQAEPIPALVELLKFCKKHSKTTEKCIALIESLVAFEEGRISLLFEEGGVLAVVEVLENGSPQSREHAVGALLTMCESDRCKYREPILREGVVPGLLELTVQGTPKSQAKAHALLRMLRDSPYQRCEFQPDTLENIVNGLISQIDGEEQSGKAKQMLAEMVQVSMEQSLRHLQQRALLYAPTDMTVPKHTPELAFADEFLASQ